MRKMIFILVSMVVLGNVMASPVFITVENEDINIGTSYAASDFSKTTYFLVFPEKPEIKTYNMYAYAGGIKSIVVIKNKEDLAVIMNAKSNGKKLHLVIEYGTGRHYSNVSVNIDQIIFGIFTSDE